MTAKKNTSDPCFVATIDVGLSDKMQQELTNQGFEITHPAYTLFSAQKKGVSCTLYTSGKLTVQGKDKEEFIQFYIEPEILQSVAFSYPETQVDLKTRIGVDEAGKGDFFGPLCIAGVFATEDHIKELLKIGVKDSKKMTDKAILVLSQKIKKICPHSIIRINPKRYNELYANFHNLNRLLAWGHATAISELHTRTQCTNVIIDQFASEDVVLSALKHKNIQVELTQRHKAESDPVVAAASILARAAFVEGIDQLGAEVGIELPKGASAQVIAIGKKLVAKYGESVLSTVAKMHFKTAGEVLND
ncbi:MAG: ribonuclease HIII [Verrucomicrobia bacterium]|nr:ribonuclease HIII [Verrucomicrobiota bacterium]